MRDHHEASEISPVPAPGPDAVPAELFRGIHAMPPAGQQARDVAAVGIAPPNSGRGDNGDHA
ncbi:hypothetical protein [Goodfellowiella coeruleoviolacea]|uniref:Uncharacterized protein n=1 Tax=Goodfellowiella coeruleoviolacea TaxID=334858 RepID=A0AAE3GCV1_9PSEU|nr:hypothetical protein [Goodfellowiella coeruleoviolacea]MCP2165039.1 hypothetical protein [Goodfellowiella coeruleoviolacea]